MHKAALLVAIVFFALAGVARAQPAERLPASPPQTAPDNTGRNVRDRSGTTLTPGDQSESEADRTLTQRIRQAVVAEEALSTNAKNVKIITSNGVVTLRGPVKSAQEKATIEAKAHQIAGANNVESQLEITGP
jgi:hyperosmotically inducible protein